MNRRQSLTYLWRAAAVLVADVLLVVWLERLLLAHNPASQFLALPLAFFLLHVSIVSIVVATLAQLKVRNRLFAAAVRRLEPELQAIFSEHGYGASQIEVVRELKEDPRVIERLLVDFMPSVTGDARQRLGELALEMGFVERWRQLSKSRGFLHRKEAVIAMALLPLHISRTFLLALLDDKEQEVSVLASRALVQSGEPELIERIFRFILTQSPLVRACVAEDLRKHAPMLTSGVVPKLLAEGMDARATIILEILAAWRRSFQLEGWEKLYEHASAENRVTILELLPYIADSEQSQNHVIGALSDPEARVRMAASKLAGDWQLEGALPSLSLLLLDAKVEVSRAAARALTTLGDAGRGVLEHAVYDAGGAPGRIALEALEFLAMEESAVGI